jgi:hypothetical protein
MTRIGRPATAPGHTVPRPAIAAGAENINEEPAITGFEPAARQEP